MKTNLIPLVLTIILSVVSILIFASYSNKVNAQNTGNFSELLEELNNRVTRENGFTFFVVFASSPGNSIIQAQIGGEEGFAISEMGTDYMCLNRLAGAALTKSCFPYSNIASIGFLET